MAIALKGTPIFGTAAASSNFSVDVSSIGITAGDFIIIGVCNGNTTLDRAVPSCSSDVTGAFTNDADLYANDTDDTNAWTFHATAAGADTSITISGEALQAHQYAVFVYTGVDPATPLDAAVTTATGINGDTADPPSIAPVTSGAKIVAFYFASQATSTAWIAPPGISNWNQAASSKGCIAAGDANWSGSGAFDPAAVGGGQNSTSDSWAAVTYALRPAASSGTTYNDTINETVTTSDALSNSATFDSTLSEAITANDGFAARAVFPNALTEIGSLANIVAGGLLLIANISDAVTVHDSAGTTFIATTSFSEVVAFVDALTGNATLTASLTETTPLDDSASSIALFVTFLAEDIALADSADGQIVVGSGIINVFDGESWTAKPVKVWLGASWLTKPLKHWDGESWR